MSEQLQDVNAKAQPAAPTLHPEQFEQIKKSLIDTLFKNYNNFIASINKFPVMPVPMQEAFRHFDTGFLWFKESILNMPMPQIQMVQASPQPEASGEPAMASEACEAPEAPSAEAVEPIDAA
jgi:hypothetical protein